MPTFNWKAWRVGLMLTALMGLFTAGAGMSQGMTWRAFIAVFCTYMGTALPLYLKNHPLPDPNQNPPQQGQINSNMKTSLLVLTLGAALMFTGCATQHKATVQKEPYQAPVVQTDNGTVVFPSSYVAFTNSAGNVQVFPCYSAIVNTNAIQFSVKRFLWGGDHTLTAFVDRPYEMHTGSGRALLVDSKYNQLDSQFNSGARFSGNSHLSVGSVEYTVSTNGISATGNAGNQLLTGLGSMLGQFLHTGATGQ